MSQGPLMDPKRYLGMISVIINECRHAYSNIELSPLSICYYLQMQTYQLLILCYIIDSLLLVGARNIAFCLLGIPNNICELFLSILTYLHMSRLV